MKERGIKGISLCSKSFIEAELEQSVTKGILQGISSTGDKEREKTHFLTVSLKFYSPVFLLLLTLFSSLTRISLCKFSLLPNVICL